MAAFRRRYGAHPLHLVGTILALALAVVALGKLLDAGPKANLVLWLLGAIVLHDLIGLPAYSALDRVLTRALGVRAINHLRVPAIMAAVLLLVYFPLILSRSSERFARASGHDTDAYLGRWLAITAGLFAASAVVYAIRAVQARRGRAEAADA